MAGVFYFPIIGTPVAEGNLLSFYEAGTDVPLNVWTDSDLLIAWAQPIVLNAIGESDGPIYVSPTPSYKVVYTDSEGAAIPGYPVDMVSPSTITAINMLSTAVTILTDAQIKALPTTPITLKTAPAAGFQNRFLGATLAIDASAGAYTNVNTTSAVLEIETAAGARLALGPVNDSTLTTPLARLTTFLGATDKIAMLNPYAEAIQSGGSGSFGYLQPSISDATADYEAELIRITVNNNGSGAFTGGNAANTLRVTLYTSLEQIS